VNSQKRFRRAGSIRLSQWLHLLSAAKHVGYVALR
jgi:hypothetical protein